MASEPGEVVAGSKNLLLGSEAVDEDSDDTDRWPEDSSLQPRKELVSKKQRLPLLSEILADTAPPPYTLSNYMAYMREDDCMAPLNFYLDCEKYRRFVSVSHLFVMELMILRHYFISENRYGEFDKVLPHEIIDRYIVEVSPVQRQLKR